MAVRRTPQARCHACRSFIGRAAIACPRCQAPVAVMSIVKATFDAYAPKGADINDPAANIEAALTYAQARYGEKPPDGAHQFTTTGKAGASVKMHEPAPAPKPQRRTRWWHLFGPR